MVSYIIKKVLYGLLIFISVATVVFFLFSASFPTPDELATGQRSDEKTKQAIQREFGLDKPIWKQYILYLNDISFVSLYANKNYEDINVSKTRLIKLGEKSVVLKFPYLRRSFQSGKQVNLILSEEQLKKIEEHKQHLCQLSKESYYRYKAKGEQNRFIKCC